MYISSVGTGTVTTRAGPALPPAVPLQAPPECAVGAAAPVPALALPSGPAATAAETAAPTAAGAACSRVHAMGAMRSRARAGIDGKCLVSTAVSAARTPSSSPDATWLPHRSASSSRLSASESSTSGGGESTGRGAQLTASAHASAAMPSGDIGAAVLGVQAGVDVSAPPPPLPPPPRSSPACAINGWSAGQCRTDTTPRGPTPSSKWRQPDSTPSPPPTRSALCRAAAAAATASVAAGSPAASGGGGCSSRCAPPVHAAHPAHRPSGNRVIAPATSSAASTSSRVATSVSTACATCSGRVASSPAAANNAAACAAPPAAALRRKCGTEARAADTWSAVDVVGVAGSPGVPRAEDAVGGTASAPALGALRASSCTYAAASAARVMRRLSSCACHARRRPGGSLSTKKGGGQAG
eukprot:360344-Chlamydomonas_euryale.AAC.2